MKFAAWTVDMLEIFLFAQIALNSFVIYSYTTKESSTQDDRTLEVSCEFQFGFMCTLFQFQTSVASLFVTRYEMNQWTRWYKKNNAAELGTSTHTFPQGYSSLEDVERPQLVADENGVSSLRART